MSQIRLSKRHLQSPSSTSSTHMQHPTSTQAAARSNPTWLPRTSKSAMTAFSAAKTSSSILPLGGFYLVSGLIGISLAFALRTALCKAAEAQLDRVYGSCRQEDAPEKPWRGLTRRITFQELQQDVWEWRRIYGSLTCGPTTLRRDEDGLPSTPTRWRKRIVDREHNHCTSSAISVDVRSNDERRERFWTKNRAMLGLHYAQL